MFKMNGIKSFKIAVKSLLNLASLHTKNTFNE